MGNNSTPSSISLPTSIISDKQGTLQIKFSTAKNANTFGSLFTGGSIFDLQDKLVNSSGRTMIVATNQNDGPNTNAEEAEWVGTLSVLSPAGLSGRPRDEPLPPRILDAVNKKEVEIYTIIGVWVNPEYRRRGIGSLLVKHALEMIRLQPAESNPATDNTDNPELMDTGHGQGASRVRIQNSKQKRLVMLYVREHNDIAREMYEKIGFVMERSTNEATDSRGWMSLAISSN